MNKKCSRELSCLPDIFLGHDGHPKHFLVVLDGLPKASMDGLNPLIPLI